MRKVLLTLLDDARLHEACFLGWAGGKNGGVPHGLHEAHDKVEGGGASLAS